jgi:hypothetical protein
MTSVHLPLDPDPDESHGKWHQTLGSLGFTCTVQIGQSSPKWPPRCRCMICGFIPPSTFASNHEPILRWHASQACHAAEGSLENRHGLISEPTQWSWMSTSMDPCTCIINLNVSLWFIMCPEYNSPPGTHEFICLVCPPVHLSIYLSIHWIYLSTLINLSTYMYIYVSYTFPYLSISIFDYLYLSISIYGWGLW